MKSKIKILVILFKALIFLFHTILPIKTFNIETNVTTIYSGDPNSYFGWTLASYIYEGTPWILIGAPRSETRQPGVVRGGTVFRCVAGVPESCQEIIFDTTGSRMAYRGAFLHQTEEKSNQWFGHTLSVSGQSGDFIMACAPRYVHFSPNFQKREPVGMCYISKDHLRSFQEHSPCRTGKWGYHRQGHCQAGFSGALFKDGRRAVISGVGSWYWQGQLFLQNIQNSLNILSTKEGPPRMDDTYMGYSMALGEFDGLAGEDIAVGIPKGLNMTGKVVLMNSNLQTIVELNAFMVKNEKSNTQEQLGSYFGYSITVADLDGNKLQDVIIGAPLYNEIEQNAESFETGRVYIFFQTAKSQFQKSMYVDGNRKSQSRFGLAVASLGDINLDGFEDIVVGAPYDGPKGNGAIYIYNGKSTGLSNEYSQVVYAEDVSPYLKQFGWSFSTGNDLDRNKYPDLVVGSYTSSKAVYLKARPVIKAHIDVKLEPEIISLDDRSCTLIDQTTVPCAVLTTCVKYEGIGAPPQLELRIDTRLDAQKIFRPRAFMLTEEGKAGSSEVVRHVAQTSWCKSSYIYLETNLRDKLSPIIVQVNISLVDRIFLGQTLKPVLDNLLPSSIKKSLHIQKNCGSDNICIPNLSLIMVRPTQPVYKITGRKSKSSSLRKNIASRQTLTSANQSFTQNQKRINDQTLTIHSTLLNQLEDAFEAQLLIFAPKGLDFINVDLESDPGNVLPYGGRITCSVTDIQDLLHQAKNEYYSALNTSPQENTNGTETLNKSPSPPPFSDVLSLLLAKKRISSTNKTPTPHINVTHVMFSNIKSLITCDIGNPLTQGAKLELDVRFEVSYNDMSQLYENTDGDTLGTRTHLNFIFFLNSSNAETVESRSDNVKLISVPFETTSDLVIYGACIPDQVIYSVDNDIQPANYVNETNVGPQLIHVFEIVNKGYTTITKAELSILWPSYYRSPTPLGGKRNPKVLPLLYLMERPVIDIHGTDLTVSCQMDVEEINSLGLKIDRSERWKAIMNSSTVHNTKFSPLNQINQSLPRQLLFSDPEHSLPFNSIENKRGDYILKHHSAENEHLNAFPDHDKRIKREIYNDEARFLLQHPPTSNYDSIQVAKLPSTNTESNQKTYDNENVMSNEINCNERNCTLIKCTAGPFLSGESATLRLRSRVWVNTLIQEKLDLGAVVSSKAVLRILQIPYIKDTSNLPIKQISVNTYLLPVGGTFSGNIEAWIIILAVTAGIFILGLIGLILWKLGFFMRKRPPHLQSKLEND